MATSEPCLATSNRSFKTRWLHLFLSSKYVRGQKRVSFDHLGFEAKLRCGLRSGVGFGTSQPPQPPDFQDSAAAKIWPAWPVPWVPTFDFVDPWEAAACAEFRAGACQVELRTSPRGGFWYHPQQWPLTPLSLQQCPARALAQAWKRRRTASAYKRQLFTRIQAKVDHHSARLACPRHSPVHLRAAP